MTKKHIFLGGTCNGSEWRDKLIHFLNSDKLSYFNPVVENWTPECQAEEIKQRNECDYCLYVITPKMTGVYSIAEVVDDSNKRPTKTLFCYLTEDQTLTFSSHQVKSLKLVSKMIEINGGLVFESLNEIAGFLNN